MDKKITLNECLVLEAIDILLKDYKEGKNIVMDGNLKGLRSGDEITLEKIRERNPEIRKTIETAHACPSKSLAEEKYTLYWIVENIFRNSVCDVDGEKVSVKDIVDYVNLKENLKRINETAKKEHLAEDEWFKLVKLTYDNLRCTYKGLQLRWRYNMMELFIESFEKLFDSFPSKQQIRGIASSLCGKEGD